MKVDEALLARVYEHDLSLLDAVDAARAAAEAARTAPAADVGPALRALIGQIERLDERLTDREAILRGVK
jgi:hypothetical protein